VRGFTITGVDHPSPAGTAGVKAGDRLLKINGQFFYDLIDYRYLCAGNEIRLLVQRDGGRRVEVGIRKKYDRDLGLRFSSPTIAPMRKCRNRCLFCFIDQQPPGMRPSLYEKDDDYRLSFFNGNYITLTNIGPLDMRRIVRRGLSPLYISIHAADGEVRRRIMGNRAAGKIVAQLRELARHGIEMHGQVVICPGYNDGAVLERTVNILSTLYPSLKTVALVPVGLTMYRQGLPPLRSVTPEEASAIVNKYTPLQLHFQEKMGTPFIYLADEFYILAGMPFPPHEHYGMYQQLENGVGLARLFMNELDRWRNNTTTPNARAMQFSIVTGRAAGPLLRKFCDELAKIKGLKVHLHILPSLFWGDKVNVAGLLTAGDLREGLRSKHLGEIVFIPAVMLKDGENLFLDNVTLERLSSDLKVKVAAVNGLEEIWNYITAKNGPARAGRGESIDGTTGSNSRPAQCRKVNVL